MMRFTGLLFFTFITASALAAPTANTANYDVEVVIFEIRLPDLEGAELWTHTPSPTNIQAAPVADLPPSNDVAATLNNLKADPRYRLLLHKRWTQTAEPKSSGSAVQLLTAENELNGTLKFYLARFLHVELNVAFQPQTAAVVGGTLSASAGPVFTIAEQRRVKSNELNYFDHPKFGVLVRVSPAAS